MEKKSYEEIEEMTQAEYEAWRKKEHGADFIVNSDNGADSYKLIHRKEVITEIKDAGNGIKLTTQKIVNPLPEKNYGTLVEKADNPAFDKIYEDPDIIKWLTRCKPEIKRLWKEICPVYKEPRSLTNLKKACLEWSDKNPDSLLKKEYFQDDSNYLFYGKPPALGRIKERFIGKLCQIIIRESAVSEKRPELLPLPKATDKRNFGINPTYKLYRKI